MKNRIISFIVAIAILILTQSCVSMIPAKIVYTEKGLDYHRAELLAKQTKDGLTVNEQKMLAKIDKAILENVELGTDEILLTSTNNGN